MTIFTPFKKATGAKTPDYSGAAFRQGTLNEAEERRLQAKRSSDISGAFGLYEASPMNEYVDNLMYPEAANAAVTGAEMTEAMAALEAGVLAPEAVGIIGGALPAAPASVAPAATAATAGAGSALAGAALPIGLAALLFSLFG